jgi:hypothetical protein
LSLNGTKAGSEKTAAEATAPDSWPNEEKIIQEYQKVWPRPGVVRILVGESRPDKKFRFYAFGYGEGHRLAAPLALPPSSEIFFECTVAYQDPREVLTRKRAPEQLASPVFEVL